jgi:hypothetical protein
MALSLLVAVVQGHHPRTIFYYKEPNNSFAATMYFWGVERAQHSHSMQIGQCCLSCNLMEVSLKTLAQLIFQDFQPIGGGYFDREYACPFSQHFIVRV